LHATAEPATQGSPEISPEFLSRYPVVLSKPL
jgi:hypothetical protein